MLKAGVMLHWHYGMLRLGRASSLVCFVSTVVIIVIITTLVREIPWPLVFVCAAIVLEAADYLVNVI